MDLIEFRLSAIKDEYWEQRDLIHDNTRSGNYDEDHSDLKLLLLKEQAMKDLMELRAIYQKRKGGKS